MNAQAVNKVLRSRGSERHPGGEKLYVIENFNYSGTLIYTKGKIAREGRQEVFYLLISSKRSTFGNQARSAQTMPPL